VYENLATDKRKNEQMDSIDA